jgi:hypothetical protein
MPFGWVVLALLTGLAAVNALGLALRATPAGRAELAIAASTLFFAFLTAPVLVLGYANVLTAVNLAAVSSVLMLGLFALLVRRRSPRELLRECRHAAASILAMPFAALREAARARSVTFVGLGCAGALTGAALVAAVLYANCSWDSLIYHEPIVGFAIQNHGFSPVLLPMNDAVQATNGYPRLCEAMSIWFVIFTDRTLVELPNILAAPPMLFCAYALARRYGDRLTAMGWTSVLLLMPQTWVQLCQVYIDIAVGFFALAAIYFASRPEYRIRDALYATLAMALLMGTKQSALVMVPPIAFVAYLRLILGHVRRHPVATAGIIAGGSIGLLGIAAVSLVRNWLAFKNPLWPVDYANALLGVKWHGIRSLEALVADGPLKEVIASAYASPVGGFPDVMRRGYGYAIPWVVVPVGLFAVVIALSTAALEVVGLKERGIASNLAWVLIPVVVGLFTTPTLSGRNARYNMHLVAGLMVAITWLLSRRSWERGREGVVAASIVLSIIPVYWLDLDFAWSWGSTDIPSSPLHPFAQRVYSLNRRFDLLARERAAEIHAGDRVAFDEGVIFVGALWNFDFTSQVRFISSAAPETFLAEVDAYDPKWVAVGNPPARTALERAGRWEYVGKLTEGGDHFVFRRTRP